MRKLKINTAFFFWAALLVLFLPVRWLSAAFAAAAFHELCHYLAVLCLGGQVYEICLCPGGASIRASPLSLPRELIAVLAGPAGGFLLALLSHNWPVVGLCGLLHSIYNLLPVPSLDGGRALRCGTEILFSQETADRICGATENLCLVTLGGIGGYAAIGLRLGPLSLIPALVLFLRKIPCKSRLQRVQ